VWLNASALDARLAQGLPPRISPELTLRAQQLASDRTRRALSRALTEVVDGAARPHNPRIATAPVDTSGVLEAAGPLVSLARELRTGSDPAVRDSIVLIDAHYDHLGIGTPVQGDSIFNGADDDASGTVAVLEIANSP
jgi:hypothetical protein